MTEFHFFRARNKALERESEDLDEMTGQYTDLLETLDPSAAKKYKRRERALQSALEYEQLKNTEQYINYLSNQKIPKSSSATKSKPKKKKTQTKKSSRKYITDESVEDDGDMSDGEEDNDDDDDDNVREHNRDNDSDIDAIPKRLSIKKNKKSSSKTQNGEDVNIKQQFSIYGSENVTRKISVQPSSEHHHSHKPNKKNESIENKKINNT